MILSAQHLKDLTILRGCEKMDHNDNLMWVVMLLSLGLGICIGILIGLANSDISEIGEMVCNEKGLGDFVDFDSSSKTIECEPAKQIEKYDGGWIEVVHPGGKEK